MDVHNTAAAAEVASPNVPQHWTEKVSAEIALHRLWLVHGIKRRVWPEVAEDKCLTGAVGGHGIPTGSSGTTKAYENGMAGQAGSAAV